jgi:hypothetical protein
MDSNLMMAVLILVVDVIAVLALCGLVIVVAESRERLWMQEWDQRESERRQMAILQGKPFIPQPDPYRHLRRRSS